MNQSTGSQCTLGLGGLLGQDVTLEGVFTLHFSGAGGFEPLLGTGIRFHFRHGSDFYLLIRFPAWHPRF